jgi:hypothetical protein
MLNFKKLFRRAALALALFTPAAARASLAPQPYYAADGAVLAITRSAGITYLGGSFSNLGTAIGGVALLDSSGVWTKADFPDSNGEVRAIEPDGAGGYWIGGSFSQFNGLAASNLVHVDNTGALKAPAVTTFGRVEGLKLVGSTLYLWGTFSQVNGTSRARLAAVNASTGGLLNWNPLTGFPVITAFAHDGSTVYLGGNFSSMGGQSRPYLGAVADADSSTGWATAWNPGGPSSTFTGVFLPRPGKIIVGLGGDTPIGATYTSKGLAWLDPVTGANLGYDPLIPLFSSVTSLVYDGAHVYVAGSVLGSFQLTPVNQLLRVDPSTGALDTGWIPSFQGLSSPVIWTDAGSSLLYVGGRNANYPGGRVGAVRKDTAAIDPSFNPNSSASNYYAFASHPGGILMGGDFDVMNMVSRRCLAALDNTGALLPWNPNVGNTVRQMLLGPANTVIVGGDFTSVNGSLSRGNVAQFADASGGNTGSATAWNPNISGINSKVYALSMSSTAGPLFIGGDFGAAGVSNTARNRLAAFNIGDNSPLPWNPSNGYNITSLLAESDYVYVGGNFLSNIGGQNRNRIAKVDASSSATGWAYAAFDALLPNGLGTAVEGLARDGAYLYMAGNFSYNGTHSYLARVDAVTGAGGSTSPMAANTLPVLNPAAGSSLKRLFVDNGILYVAGEFTSIGGVLARGLAAVRLSDNVVNGVFDPSFVSNSNPSGNIVGFAVEGNDFWAGGTFETAFGSPQSNLVHFTSDAVFGTATPSPTITPTLTPTQTPTATYSPVQSPTPTQTPAAGLPRSQFITNGNVRAMAQLGNRLYLGGTFTLLAPKPNELGRLDAATGLPQDVPPVTGGSGISAVVPDGSGGWYLGGSFTAANGLTMTGLAHIHANGTVNQYFRPTLNGQVLALAVGGSRLYVAGFFTTVNGTSRPYLAAVDRFNGALQPFVAAVQNVNAMAYDSGAGTLYVGGSFTGFNSRNRLAALDSTGAVRPFFVTMTAGTVNALALDSGKLYVGGNFTALAGNSRFHLGAVDAITGVIDGFYPNNQWTNTDNSILALLISGGKLYAGGDFTLFGGASRQRLAACSLSGPSYATDPYPSLTVGGTVNSLGLNGTRLVFGGAFTTVSGAARAKLASVDTATGVLDTAFPQAVGAVNCLLLEGNILTVGGSTILGVGAVPRSNLAALDLSTGLPDPFRADVTGGGVLALAVSATANRLYVGGSFSAVSGVTRNRLAAVDAVTGALVSGFNPNPNSNVRALALVSDRLYLGGDFSTVGLSRLGLAAVDGSGIVVGPAFNTNAGGQVHSLALDGNALYVGGLFSTLANFSRSNLAALDVAGTTVAALAVGANSTVFALQPQGPKLYVGGQFTQLGGFTRAYLGAVDIGGNTVAAFNPSANGPVQALASDGAVIFAAGQFSVVNSQSRNYAAAWIDGTGALDSWNPNLNNYAYSVLSYPGNVAVGGDFTTSGAGLYGTYSYGLFAAYTPAGTPTYTSTSTPTPTITATPSITETVTDSPTASETPSVTATPSETQSYTVSPTWTESSTVTESRTASPTRSPTPTSTETPPFTATPSVTLTRTSSFTHTSTITVTFSRTATQTATPSHTPTSTGSPTPSVTATFTATRTATPTPTSTASPTRTASPTATLTGTVSFTGTRTATASSTVTASFTHTRTASPSSTATPSSTQTLTFSSTPTPTASPTQTATPNLTQTVVALSWTPTPTVTLTDTPSFLRAAEPVILAPQGAPQGTPICLGTQQRVQRSTWTVYSMAGQRVAALSFGSQPSQCLATGNLAPGFYFVLLDVTLADGSVQKKTLKVAIGPP